MWARLMTVLLGLWLMASPAVLRFGGAARINVLIAGPLIAAAGIIAISEITRPFRWLNVALGAWLVISSWLFGHTWAVLLSDIVAGVLVALLACVHGRIEQRYGGGWSSLWSQRQGGGGGSDNA